MEVQYKLGRSADSLSYIECVAHSSADFDDTAYKAADDISPDFLLPMNRIGVNRPLELRFSLGENYIPLNTDGWILSRRDFFTVFRNVIEALLDCGDCFLERGNLDLNFSRIYVNKLSFQIKLPYIPILEKLYSDTQCIKNVIQVIRKTKIADGTEIKGRFFELISEDNTLTELLAALNEIEDSQMIYNNTKKGTQDADSVSVAVLASNDLVTEIIDMGSGFAADRINADNSSITEIIGLNETSATEMINLDKAPVTEVISLGGASATEIIGRGSSPATEVISMEADNSSATEIISSNSSPVTEILNMTENKTEIIDTKLKIAKAYLKYAGKPFNRGILKERIDITLNDNSFIIGRYDGHKVNEQNDYEFPLDGNTKSISRKHARIEYHNGVYSITDLGSAYGTKVNSEKLSANVPRDLKNKDKITFSRGEFSYLFINEGK